MTGRPAVSSAFRFVLTIGIVNLFADFTYEGARGITGPFLGSLGGSAALVGFVAGFGELMGYGLRSVSGYCADKSRRYWTMAFVGYVVNMFAVPALALAGNLPVAAGLIVLERTGRAIRRPAVEAMISHAGSSIGQGWVFGFNEALDQAGATVGPLLTAWVLSRHGGYQQAFGTLLVPAVLCVAMLTVARVGHPRPHELDVRSAARLETGGLSTPYWLYVIAGALIAAGFADFALVGFHFQRAGIMAPSVIPILYAVAMAAGALASLVFGRSFDKLGRPVLLLAFLLPAFFAAFVFQRSFALAVVGVVLWGIGLGAQDSLMKAALAGVVSADRRGTAFGVFDTTFGIAWFAGSAVMGLLYGASMAALIAFSVAVQLAALPLLLIAGRRREQSA
jgi:predicted MFS family arabinose efflux permease